MSLYCFPHCYDTVQNSYNGPPFGKKKRLYFAGTNFNVNLLPQTVFLLGGIGCRLECFVNIIIIHFYCSVLQALLGSSKESSPSYSTNTGGYISPITSHNPLSTSSYNTPSSSYRAPSPSSSYSAQPDASDDKIPKISLSILVYPIISLKSLFKSHF